MNLCLVEDCDHKYEVKGYCKKHYDQIRNYGKILSADQRTRLDPNEFIIDGDICWVILYNIKCEEIARAKFLIKYYEQIVNSKIDLKWNLTTNGYVRADWSDENGKYQILLHQAIIQLSGQVVQPGEEIDHKDGDKLNCLDDNLRICTHIQNARNRRKQKNTSSEYKGVTWNKQHKKWKAFININNKQIFLGLFDIEENSARAYNTAAIKYFGEFAVLNNV